MPGKSREYHRFMSVVDQDGWNGCWIWKGAVNKEGYGVINRTFNYPGRLAHRNSYEFFKGPIPEKAIICHKCDNPPCVNPEHLFLGTHQMNARDKVNKGRDFTRYRGFTHCKHGHEFSEENTRIRKNGNRTCTMCEKIRHLNNKQKGEKYVNY